MARIIAAADEPFGTICLILAFTGMRIGEALAIRREDLDFDLKLIHVRHRRVSTTLRQVLTEFSEVFHVSRTGLLIQTSLGRAGGLGALRTKSSG